MIRTDRPTPELSPTQLTVADVVDLAPVRDGEPEVVVGGTVLTRPVRWLHVADSPKTPHFLAGGELVLTTGSAWPEDTLLDQYVHALLDTGPVGLVIELGTRFTELHDSVVEPCRDRGVALVVLRREVRFVEVTEAAHRLLVAAQVRALETREEVQSRFTELNRGGASAGRIVEEAAVLLHSPVVLEDLAHRVVWCASHDTTESEVLHDWSRLSWAATPPEGSRVRAVEARGRYWGRLVATRVPPETTPGAVELVLQQATLALSLGAMAAATEPGSSWEALRQRRVVRSLTERDVTSPRHLVELLESAGMRVGEGPVVGVGLVLGRSTASTAAALLDQLRHAAGRAADARRIGLCCGPDPAIPGGVLAVLVLPADHPDPVSVVDSFVARLRAEPLPIDVAASGRVVTPDGRDTDALLASLAEAQELLETARPGTPGVVRSAGAEVDLLTRALPQSWLHGYVDALIGPVLRYDARHGTELLPALEAYLRHPGNRTRAAQDSHVSRSVFYQRLELLESLLGRDLRDGNTLAALHVAVTAYQRTSQWSTD